MRTVAELMQDRKMRLDRAHEILEAVDLDGGRAMTEAEETEYNMCMDSVEALSADIERRQRFEQLESKVVTPAPRKVEAMAPREEISNQPVERPSTEMRTLDRGIRVELLRSAGRMVAFDNNQDGRVQAYRCGMWLRATLYNDIRAAEWCRINGVQSALSGGVNTAGGVLVPEEFERTIIDLREQYGLFRQQCRVAPMGTDTRNIPRRTGGLTAYFVGENESGTESDKGWDNVQLVAKKLMVLTRMSSEINEDAIISLADDLAMEIAYAFAVKEDSCGFNGDGTSTYGGMTGVLVKAIDGSHALAKVAAASTHDTLGEIDSDDLLSLMSALPVYAKAGAAWYCSPTAQELVFNAIKIAGGGTTRDMLAQGDVPRFLGYPIYVTPVMADSSSTTYNGEVMVAFGNLRQAATMGDRRGIRVALSTEQYWEEDQIGVKGTQRFDIVAHDLGSATVKSPFAVLVGTT